jgi:hypothetical protein
MIGPRQPEMPRRCSGQRCRPHGRAACRSGEVTPCARWVPSFWTVLVGWKGHLAGSRGPAAASDEPPMTDGGPAGQKPHSLEAESVGQVPRAGGTPELGRAGLVLMLVPAACTGAGYSRVRDGGTVIPKTRQENRKRGNCAIPSRCGVRAQGQPSRVGECRRQSVGDVRRGAQHHVDRRKLRKVREGTVAGSRWPGSRDRTARPPEGAPSRAGGRPAMDKQRIQQEQQRKGEDGVIRVDCRRYDLLRDAVANAGTRCNRSSIGPLEI